MKGNHSTTPPFQPYRTRQNKARDTRKIVLSRHPHLFNHTTHAKTEPRRQKTRTVPPPTPAKCPNILVPARRSTQRRLTHTNMYVTRPARKFPRAQHTQLRRTERKTINIHTPLTRITVNKRQRNFHHLNAVLQHMILF
jgi:hypothetical protein